MDPDQILSLYLIEFIFKLIIFKAKVFLHPLYSFLFLEALIIKAVS